MPSPDNPRGVRTRTNSGNHFEHSDVPPPYTPAYSRVSSFRSPQLEVLLYCPAVKTVSAAWASTRTLPAYGDHDVVGGKIIVDPSCLTFCARILSAHNLIEYQLSGTIIYDSMDEDVDHLERAGKRRHVFFLRSDVIHVSSSDLTSSRLGFRQMFKRRQTIDSMESETRAFPFAFELARSKQWGNILPPTFSPSDSTRAPFEIAYQVTAIWEPLKVTAKSSLLTIPIVIRPDPDFQSLDEVIEGRISWLEIPLKSHRPIPFQCAITLPTSLTFARTSSIPFFVVFTTVPRSKTLAREIATDATISISVLRQMTITEDSAVISTTPETLLNGLSEARSLRFKTKVLKRIKSKSSLWSQSSMTIDPPQKPLPSLPAHCFSDTRIVYNGMCIGFPKRPRHQLNEQKEHPTLHAHRALPDGLHKGTITLNRNMLASIDWGGVSLKYFLEVTVLLGQDELRTKMMIRIT
ncbi:hypothetical protein DFH09DRAFT_1028637 [Mycena vulgaris]|nr:hypothetical protein DFH09DRAFT_1028637 [Mycena vulgaris]